MQTGRSFFEFLLAPSSLLDLLTSAPVLVMSLMDPVFKSFREEFEYKLQMAVPSTAQTDYARIAPPKHPEQPLRLDCLVLPLAANLPHSPYSPRLLRLLGARDAPNQPAGRLPRRFPPAMASPSSSPLASHPTSLALAVRLGHTRRPLSCTFHPCPRHHATRRPSSASPSAQLSSSPRAPSRCSRSGRRKGWTTGGGYRTGWRRSRSCSTWPPLHPRIRRTPPSRFTMRAAPQLFLLQDPRATLSCLRLCAT